MAGCPSACGKDKLKPACKSLFSKLLSVALEYDTVKHVHVRNLKIGLIFRTIQFLVLVFIGIYILWYLRGIYEVESVKGTITTKLKGVSRTNGSGSFENAGNITWDEAEYVIPPREPRSFFVMTNMWITHRQSDGECPEAKSVSEAHCQNDSDCHPGGVFREGHGEATGVCNMTTETCMVRAWCPVEEENKNITRWPKLLKAEDFTVLIKSSIQFPRLAPNFHRRNIPSDDSFLKTCLFDEDNEKNKTCPIFTLKSIVKLIHNGTTFSDLAAQGAVVGLNIRWSCDVTWWNGLNGRCSHEYKAVRLDSPDSEVSAGYNFRFARYWYENEVQYRDLYKAYGILFQVETVGEGLQVSFKQIFISIGSGLSYLVVATYITDFVVMYCLRKSSLYSKHKYHMLKDDKEDTFLILNDDLVDSVEDYGSVNSDTMTPVDSVRRERKRKTGS